MAEAIVTIGYIHQGEVIVKGTGFILKSESETYLLTCEHVIRDCLSNMVFYNLVPKQSAIYTGEEFTFINKADFLSIEKNGKFYDTVIYKISIDEKERLNRKGVKEFVFTKCENDYSDTKIIAKGYCSQDMKMQVEKYGNNQSNMKLYNIEAVLFDLPIEMLNKNGFSKNIKDVRSAVIDKKYEIDSSGMSGCPVFNKKNGEESIIGIMNGEINAAINNFPIRGITFTELSKVF